MKNLKSKSVKFRTFFGFLLILTISAIVFGQETKDTPSTSDANNNTEKKEEKKEPLKLKDCAPQGYDCQIDYYTEQIAKPESGNIIYSCLKCSLYQSRGIIYYKKGDFTNALNDFNFVIEEIPYYRSPYLYRGKIYEKMGNYDSALNDYLSYRGKDAELFLGLGNIYRYKREYEKALANYNKAIYENRRLSKAYFGRAVIYLEFGKVLNQSNAEEDKEKAIKYFKDALKDLDSVIEIDLLATEAETYLRRSQVYRQLGETEKADADFQKYNELDEAPKIK